MTQLATRERTNAVVPTGGVQPAMLTIDNIWMLAEQVSASKMFKGVDTPQKAFVLMMICESEGIHPMKALQIYHIIEGKPSIQSSALQARFIQAGGVIEIVEASKKAAVAIFSHPKHCPKPKEFSYTLEDARVAGLANKDVYRQNSEDMLWWRLISKTINKIMPGLKNGIPTTEEAMDEANADDMLANARVEAAKAGLDFAAPERPAPPAEVVVDGGPDMGFDGRPYHQVVTDAVAVTNATHQALWARTLGGDITACPALNPHDVHKHLLHAAINLGYATGPAPTKLNKALEALNGVYKAERAWVRRELQDCLVEAEDRFEEALEAAQAAREPEAGTKAPDGDDAQARRDFGPGSDDRV